MLVCLQYHMEHLSCLFTCLIRQTLSNSQQSGESQLNNLVEVGSVFARFEAVNATNGKKALEAGEDRGSIVCIEELDSDVYKGGPFLGEVVVEDLLEDWDELLSDLGWGGCQDR